MTKQKLGMKLNSVRNHNIKVVMSFLYKKPYSCLELSKKIGISDVGVRKIIRELEDFGLVRVSKAKQEVKTRGNQHIRYTANKDTGCFLLIDYTQRKEMFYLLDFAGNVLMSEKFEVPEFYTSEDDIVQLIEKIKGSISSNGFSKKRILHTVVGLTGQIDEESKSIIFSRMFQSFTGEKAARLYELFEEGLGVPVKIINNVALMAMGEISDVRKNDYRMLLFVYAGFGISTSILYNGEPLLASRGYAGEIGGNRMGYKNTLSRTCSLRALIEECKGLLEEDSFEGLLDGYAKNDEVKQKVLQNARIFGTAIADFSVCLGADKVILSGEILEFGKEYVEKVEKEFAVSMYKPEISLGKTANPFVEGALKVARWAHIERTIEKKSS